MTERPDCNVTPPPAWESPQMRSENEILIRFRPIFRGAAYHGFGFIPGFSIYPGWFDIVWELAEAIEAEAEAAGIPISSKSYPWSERLSRGTWGLEFHGHDLTDAMREHIDAATVKSRSTCETCGAPGKIYKAGPRNNYVACPEHIRAEGDP